MYNWGSTEAFLVFPRTATETLWSSPSIRQRVAPRKHLICVVLMTKWRREQPACALDGSAPICHASSLHPGGGADGGYTQVRVKSGNSIKTHSSVCPSATTNEWELASVMKFILLPLVSKRYLKKEKFVTLQPRMLLLIENKTPDLRIRGT